ncbi:MAG: helix-turn-helix domain-containing protein [Enterocloster bolteae]
MRRYGTCRDYVNDNTLTVYIKRLRIKLRKTGSSEIIETSGRGYKVDERWLNG